MFSILILFGLLLVSQVSTSIAFLLPSSRLTIDNASISNGRLAERVQIMKEMKGGIWRGRSKTSYNIANNEGEGWMVLKAMFDTLTDMEVPLPPPKEKVAIIIVDRGSRKQEANDQLYALIDTYKALTGYTTVEGAHLEVLEPSIGTSFEKCVNEGATHVIAHPLFLTNGRHVLDDIPREMKEAGEKFPHIQWSISKPLGAQESIPKLVQKSILECMYSNDINPLKVERNPGFLSSLRSPKIAMNISSSSSSSSLTCTTTVKNYYSSSNTPTSTDFESDADNAGAAVDTDTDTDVDAKEVAKEEKKRDDSVEGIPSKHNLELL